MILRSEHITTLLQAARQGTPASADQLMSAVYTDLRKVARRYMSSERGDHTLQPTAVVNEVLLRLFHPPAEGSAGGWQSVSIDWESRTHFLGIAAKQMRQVLIDHARQKRSIKRDFGIKVRLDDKNADSLAADASFEFETLNQLLDLLAAKDKDAAQVFELKFFGGLTFEEAAEVMHSNYAKARRDWEFARSWLRHRLVGSGKS
jgi:RNA polymerase sigma-70 factor (ECF subfamily)